MISIPLFPIDLLVLWPVRPPSVPYFDLNNGRRATLVFCLSQREALGAACSAYIRFILAAFEGAFALPSSLFSYLTSYHYQELEYQINDTLKASIAIFSIGRIPSLIKRLYLPHRIMDSA